jgi:riboflavin kinase
MLEQLWFTLLSLARLGAGRDSVQISTPRLADVLGISQQSASRRLRALEKRGWIRRTLINRGQVVRIQPEGLSQLSQIRSTLELVFADKTVVTINGRVLTGLGEGAYYVHLDGYRRQFRVKLGFDPFPGTLNIQLITDADVSEFQMLKATAGVQIQGFVSGNRSFGPVVCYPAMVGSQIQGAILLIQRTHHERNVIEVIAPVNLREQLRLKDGDIVSLTAQISA